MRKHRVLLGTFWLALSVVVLTGCNTGKGVTDPAVQFSNLRVANVVPDASGPLNVTVDGSNLASGVNFGTLTPYKQISSGARAIQVSVAGSANNIISTSLTFTGTINYTLVTYGSVEEPASLLVDDTVVDPGAGNFNVRAINTATGAAAVDVYVTALGADLNAAAPTVAGVALGSTSAFATLPTGNYQIRITAGGTKEIIYDSVAQTFAEKAQVEIVIYSLESSKLVGTTLVNIDSTGTSVTTPNLLSQFKVVNGSSVSSPLNVFVNQDLQLSNIPFGGASSYQKTAAGSPSISVEATATPGATLLTIMPTLGPGTDSSILFTGPAGALRALVLSDSNLPPVPIRARVRFVNGTNDISALDVFVNFSKQVAGLAMNSAAAGLEFNADPDAGTSYEIDFNVAGTSQTSLKLPAVTLFGGRTYTIYVVGSQVALTGIVTEDN
jgi:Domain of unknown function (DUF4397)